jgi:peptide/nickel transport system substrate-binding protein
VNEDGSEWTFNLRKGMKWSDGEPFTVEGTKWYLEYWNGDETLNQSGNPPGWASTGTPRVMGDITFPGDYTMTIKFADPKPLFIYDFQRGTLNNEPGYYLQQFHMELTEDKAALEAASKEAGFETWDQYFLDRRWWYMNPDLPQYGVWVGTNPLSEEIHFMDRNPYFFQVDPEGQQLPYVDRVQHRLGDNTEVFNMWIVNGEIDFQARGVGIGNYTLYKESEESGDYQVYLGISAGHQAIQLNLSTKNERLNGFYNKRNVRIALMYAINREEINDLVFDGLLTPRQYSPLSASPQYYEKLSNSYIEFDPEMSNDLLDEAGYSEKDSEGFRLWDDGSGELISFVVEGTSETSDVMELVTKYWADVGIKITYKYFERSLYSEHFAANEIEGAYWGGDRTVLPLAPGAPIFRGTMIDRPWCAGWGLWFNSQGADASGVEPPEGHWIWDIWDLWDQITKVADQERQNELFFQICDIWAEEVPMIGMLGEAPSPIIVKNGVVNYKPGMPLDDTLEDEHLLNTQTYFWDI